MIAVLARLFMSGLARDDTAQWCSHCVFLVLIGCMLLYVYDRAGCPVLE